MKIYIIRFCDSAGIPRLENVIAGSVVEALRKVNPNDGEIIEQVYEHA